MHWPTHDDGFVHSQHKQGWQQQQQLGSIVC